MTAPARETSTACDPVLGAGPGPALDAASPATTSDQSADERLAMALGSAAVFFIALELTIIAIALPEISRSYPDSTRATLSWIFTAYNVGVAGFLLIGGWLAERFGRKRLFLTGLAVFTVGSLASGLAPGVELLIGARAVQAVGGALLIPASLAVVLHAVPQPRHDTAIGIWGAMAGMAAAIGPTLGAVLVNGVGWRAVFLVNVPLALAVAGIGAARLDESNDPDIDRHVDLLAVPAGAFAVGLLVFIIVAAETLGWTDPVTLGCCALAMALLALFVHRSRRHRAPVFDPAIAATPSFAVGSIGTLLFVAGFTGWLVFAPTFLTEVWGYSVFAAGFAVAPGPLVMAITAGPAGRAASRFGHGPVIWAGALLAVTATLWWIVVIGPEPNYVKGLLPGMVLLGGGVGAAFPMLTAATLRQVEPHRYAMGAAGATTIRQVAMALGIAVVAAIVGPPAEAGSSVGPYTASWAVCGGLFLLSALVVSALPKDFDPSNAGRQNNG